MWGLGFEGFRSGVRVRDLGFRNFGRLGLGDFMCRISTDGLKIQKPKIKISPRWWWVVVVVPTVIVICMSL